MKFDLEQLRDVSLGAVRVTQEEDGFHFYRFSEEQESLYKSRSEALYKKTFCTSGVQLRFRTNSEKLLLKTLVSPGTTRRYFAFEVFIDGTRVGTVDNFSAVELPQSYVAVDLPLGAFSKEFCLGKGEKEVCVNFPWSVVAVLQELALEDGATVKPIKPKFKMLCFGDSITHGYDALYPSNKYISRLAAFLDAEEFNKAIGAEIFFPELAAARESFQPDYISVAYGTNDWSACSKEEFTFNCHTFFRNLSRNYSHARILAISPIWRKDMMDYRKFGAFHEVEEVIRETTKGLNNISVISGVAFVPQQEELYADLRLHPNDRGFEYYYRGLISGVENI